jgi:hypothetical protein
MYDPPLYLWVLTFAGVIGALAMTCVVLYRGAERAGLGRRRATLLSGGAAVLLGGWLAASAAIAATGTYHVQPGKGIPWFGIVPGAFFLVLLATTRIPMVSRALSGPGTVERLLHPHAFRVAGLAFVITMILGHLPALFAVPAGLGDFAVGLAAPRVARRLAAGDLRGAKWFNILGITDLVVAMTLGGLTGYHVIHVPPANSAISLLPLAVIPTVEVPVLLVLHIMSLRRLRSAPPAARPAAESLSAAG